MAFTEDHAALVKAIAEANGHPAPEDYVEIVRRKFDGEPEPAPAPAEPVAETPAEAPAAEPAAEPAAPAVAEEAAG